MPESAAKSQSPQKHFARPGEINFHAGYRVVWRNRLATVVAVEFASASKPVYYTIQLDNAALIRTCAKHELELIAPLPQQKGQQCKSA